MQFLKAFVPAILTAAVIIKLVSKIEVDSEKQSLLDMKSDIPKKADQFNRKLVNLTKRQKYIYKLIKSQREVEMDDLEKKITNVHVRTIRRDLSKLEESDLIEKIGKTKGAFYKIS